jgi:hypothetical protein
VYLNGQPKLKPPLYQENQVLDEERWLSPNSSRITSPIGERKTQVQLKITGNSSQPPMFSPKTLIQAPQPAEMLKLTATKTKLKTVLSPPQTA